MSRKFTEICRSGWGGWGSCSVLQVLQVGVFRKKTKINCFFDSYYSLKSLSRVWDGIFDLQKKNCCAKIREKVSSTHYLSSLSFLSSLIIHVYSSVIIIEEKIWISVRIKSWPFFHKIEPKPCHIPKKRVIWGLSTFKPKSKYTVVFVDFVVCGYIKTCHVDGANYSLAQFENNWNESVPVITISCRKEVIIVSQ